jgi:uncharacterized protein (DUF302 family)
VRILTVGRVGGNAANSVREAPDALPVSRRNSRAVGYVISRPTPLDFAAALARTREALTAEGFGVLCEIDVQATMKEKLGEEVGPYTILGACNAPLAHRALGEEPEVGVLLPCNVVVRVEDGETVVEAVDPEGVFSLVGEPELEPVASEVRERLVRVVTSVDG